MAKKYMAGSLSRLEHHNIPDLPEQEVPELMTDRQRETMVTNSIIKLGAEIGKVVGENEANERLMEYSAEMQSKLLSLKEMSASEQKKAYNNGALDQIYKRHFEAGEKSLFGSARTRFQKALNTNYQTSQVQAYKHILSVAKGEQNDIFKGLKAQARGAGGADYAAEDSNPTPMIQTWKKSLGLTDEQEVELDQDFYKGKAENLAATLNLKALKKVLPRLSIPERAKYEGKMPIYEKNNTLSALELTTSQRPRDFISGALRFKQSSIPDKENFANTLQKVYNQNIQESIKGNYAPNLLNTILKNKPADMTLKQAEKIKSTFVYHSTVHPDQLYEALTGKNWGDLPRSEREEAGFLVTYKVADDIFNAHASGDQAQLDDLLDKNGVDRKDLKRIIRLSFDGKIRAAQGEKAKTSLRVVKFITVDIPGSTGIPANQLERLGSKGEFIKLDEPVKVEIVAAMKEKQVRKLIATHGRKGFEYLMMLYGAFVRDTQGDQLTDAIGTPEYNHDIGKRIGKAMESAVDALVTVVPATKEWRNLFGLLNSDDPDTEDGFFMSRGEWAEYEPTEQANVVANFKKLTLKFLKDNPKYIGKGMEKYMDDADALTLIRQENGDYHVYMISSEWSPRPLAGPDNRVIIINPRRLASANFMPYKEPGPTPFPSGISPRDKYYGGKRKSKKRTKTKPGSGVLARENETFP